MAAHLAGAVAAHTLRPVLGVPLPGGVLDGVDALLSTVQMPAGIPVATFAVGPAGARNAAFFAAQVVARERPPVASALQEIRREGEEKVRAGEEQVNASLAEEGS
jgi:5-(carboxyamino)imidazole ribonucleotide mutase